MTVAGFMSWIRSQLPGIFYKGETPVWRLSGVVPSARDVFVPRGAYLQEFDEPEDSSQHLWQYLDVGMGRFVRVFNEELQFVCELSLFLMVRACVGLACLSFVIVVIPLASHHSVCV